MVYYYPDRIFNLLFKKLKELKKIKEISNEKMIPIVQRLIDKGEVKGGAFFKYAGKLTDKHKDILRQYQEELRKPLSTFDKVYNFFF